MAENLGDAVLELRIDDGSFNRGMGRAGGAAKRMGKSMAKVGAGISAGIGLPIAAMARAAFTELDAIQKANQQTAAAIKRVGKGSLVSVSGVQKLAGSLQDLSGIDDQVIQSGQNMLLTLGGLDLKTKSGAKTFNKASRAMVDFAEATGTTADAAGKQFAKSLAAASQKTLLLPRGLKLAANEQKRLEKAFGKGSTAASRQAALIAVLGKKFEGSSKKTNAERWDVITDKLAGLGATIAEQLMPEIDRIAGAISRWTAKFQALDGGTKRIIAVVAGVGLVLGPLVVVIGVVIGALGAIAGALAAVSLPVIAVIAAIAAVGIALVMLYRKSATFRKMVNAAFVAVKREVMSVLAEIKLTLATWGRWATSFWKSNGAAILASLESAWKLIAAVAGPWLAMIANLIKFYMAIFRGDWGKAWAAIKKQLKLAWVYIKAAIKLGLAAVKAYLKLAGRVWGTILSAAWNAIKSGTRAAWNAIKSAIGSAWVSIKAAISNKLDDIKAKVGAAFKKLPSIISGAASSIGNAAKSVGTAIFNGIWDKVKDIGERIADSVRDAVNGVLDKLRSFELPGFKIGNKKFGGQTPFSGIPRLADGGIVDRPTLALIGEAGPEAVVPLNRGGYGRPITVNINEAKTPELTARAVMRALEKSDGRQRAYSPRIAVGR